MRKLNYLTIIGLLFFASCSTNPAEIKVSSLETLCDHVEALGEIYDEMEEIIGGIRRDEVDKYNKMCMESEELMALNNKEDQIKYSMANNTFRFSEQLFKDCPKGEKYYSWLNK